jgi:hypothetical protein
MIGGAASVVVPLALIWAYALRQCERMLEVLGRPLESGERVHVVSGPLKDRLGVIELLGQGGQGTLFVRMDDSSEDELIVFSWHQLRRVDEASDGSHAG